ncbi:SAM dependent methyltransferase [Brachionus plicatilis]|uniref:SAM dependent methyltransferase n=1 Tax=Brachionus plicatilis TaxID=10195 RepID=A0A3M7PB59_BRAPC|nr:SAM dependent methyltransferase [Brachionus plicatilis]
MKEIFISFMNTFHSMLSELNPGLRNKEIILYFTYFQVFRYVKENHKSVDFLLNGIRNYNKHVKTWIMEKNFKFFILIFFTISTFGIFFNAFSKNNTQNCRNIQISDRKFTNDHRTSEELFTLSLLLTENAKKLGQLSCQLNKNEVSDNGGWCSKISGKNSSQHKTDSKMAKYLSKFLSGKSVASFGDGPGMYKEILLNFGDVKSYDAFDGAPFCEQTTNNQVAFLDLTIPIYHLKKFDWVLSIEVAEHIPQKFEKTYVKNLVRHAKEGILNLIESDKI